MSWIPLPYRILIGAAFMAIVYGAGFWSAWHIKTLSEKAALVDAETVAIHEIHLADLTTERISIESAEQMAQIQNTTLVLVQETHTYVSQKADAACVVPVGFQRLHDAAASGLPIVPDPTGRPDDSGTAIALSTVAGTVIRNYGACRSAISQLTALQGWITAQQALSAKAGR